jgi:hypothetical protein
MKNGRKPARVELTRARVARDSAIEAKYQGNPSPRELHGRGDLDQEAYERVEQGRAEGAPDRPFRALINALRKEREQQGLSLADVARRSGMDRAAIHKLEIGLNKNPTFATLARYADSLGKRIEMVIKEKAGKSSPLA